MPDPNDKTTLAVQAIAATSFIAMLAIYINQLAKEQTPSSLEADWRAEMVKAAGAVAQLMRISSVTSCLCHSATPSVAVPDQSV